MKNAILLYLALLISHLFLQAKTVYVIDISNIAAKAR